MGLLWPCTKSGGVRQLLSKILTFIGVYVTLYVSTKLFRNYNIGQLLLLQLTRWQGYQVDEGNVLPKRWMQKGCQEESYWRSVELRNSYHNWQFWNCPGIYQFMNRVMCPIVYPIAMKFLLPPRVNISNWMGLWLESLETSPKMISQSRQLIFKQFW